MICVLCGGVGAAKFLAGLVAVVDPAEVTAVVNTGDDVVLHGLHISPDIDTILYTLGGRSNDETGWGLAGDSFRSMEALEMLGGDAWFRLGDLDLGTHLYRSGRLRDGATLTRVTEELARAQGVHIAVLPMSDRAVPTLVTLRSGETVSFQDYFVRLHHSVEVGSVDFAGAAEAEPAPGVIASITSAERLVIAPSNPILSIGPILAIQGVASALAKRRESVIAVSPIIGGRALKGPADRLLAELGEEVSVVGVARRLAPVCGTLVVDTADEELAPAVEKEGVRCVVTETVMSTSAKAAALAEAVLRC